MNNSNHHSDEDWADFVRNVADSHSRIALRLHLDEGCQRCTDLHDSLKAVQAIAEADGQYEPPPGTVRLAKALYEFRRPVGPIARALETAKLLFDSRVAPLPAGVRSVQGEPRKLLFAIGDLLIDLQIAPGRHPQITEIIGQITAPSHLADRFARQPVVLRRQGLSVADTTTNTRGEFQLEFAGSPEDLSLTLNTDRDTAVITLGYADKDAVMKRRFTLLLLSFGLLLGIFIPPAEAADTRLIVRVNGGLPVIQAICALLRCTVNYGLGDPDGQVFLVTAPTNLLLPGSFQTTLSLQLGVASVELDLQGNVLGGSGSAPVIPDALYDRTPVDYFGTTVRHGYVNQPAAQIIGLATTQSQFQIGGAGIVAVIDTGVDPTHPVLVPVLLPGYDFTRNRDGADEKGDVGQSTAAVVDGDSPAWVNQSTAAVVDQSTAAAVDGNEFEAFGHGTMVAGVIHLVAPKAYILPLKAFNADGSGYTSDVIRAIYRAVNANARVLNMSFSFASPSLELNMAIGYATVNNVICVAAAGNGGQNIAVYPAGYTNRVMGVASTTNGDVRSSFSNYGKSHVWLAAPGEGIVTTYPFGTYAAAWGTSFSAPFVSGAAALLIDVNASAGETSAAEALAHAKALSSDLGNGRLDLYQAVAAWRQAVGLR